MISASGGGERAAVPWVGVGGVLSSSPEAK